MLEISWDSPNIIPLLEGIPLRLTKTEGLLRKIGESVSTSMRGNILSSSAPSGQSYAPFKRPPKDGHQLLMRKGTLIRSIGYNLLPSQDEVGVGHSTSYGVFQNDGTRTIPARQFVGLKPNDLDDMGSAVYQFAEDVLGYATGYIQGI